MIDCEECGTEYEYVHTKAEVEAMSGISLRERLQLHTLIKCPKCGNQRNMTNPEVVQAFKNRD